MKLRISTRAKWAFIRYEIEAESARNRGDAIQHILDGTCPECGGRLQKYNVNATGPFFPPDAVFCSCGWMGYLPERTGTLIVPAKARKTNQQADNTE